MLYRSAMGSSRCDECGVELKEVCLDVHPEHGCCLVVLECPSCLMQHQMEASVYDDGLVIEGRRMDFRRRELDITIIDVVAVEAE